VKRSSFRKLASGHLDFLVELVAIDRIAVACERAGPRGNRLIVAAHPGEHVAVVILDDRVGEELIGRAFQILLRQIQFAALEVRSAEAVEIRSVVGLDLERALDEAHRLVEPLAAFRQHVTQIVEGTGVLRLPSDQLTENRLRFGELLLLFQHGRQLEGQR